MTLLRVLGSLRMTLCLLLGLAAVVLASRWKEDLSDLYFLVSMGALALNLASAMAVKPRLRTGGLGLFHCCLLSFLLVLGWGRATMVHARVEVTQGVPIDLAAVDVLKMGYWHGGLLAGVSFAQGPFEIAYDSGLKRKYTRSQVYLPSGEMVEVGDDKPLVLSGYRFYTTPNKGYAPLLTWQGDDGQTATMAMHLSSYPAMAWDQARDWVTPQGTLVRLWLRLPKDVDESVAWVLAPDRDSGVLVVEYAGQRQDLQQGEGLDVPGGRLRFDGLRGWMGYRIFYDPTLPWLLGLSLLSVVGLAWHYKGRLAIPLKRETAVNEKPPSV